MLKKTGSFLLYLVVACCVLGAVATMAGDPRDWSDPCAKRPPGYKTPGDGSKGVSGSSVTGISPNPVAPGAALDICFDVNLVSADYEYMDHFDIDLPDGWTVNSVTHNPAASMCGGTTVEGVLPGNIVYWQLSTYPTPSSCGPWDTGTTTFCCNVTPPDCTGAPWSLTWNIVGDGYGGAPHSATGTIPLDCWIPTGAPVLVVSPDPSIVSLMTALSAYPDFYPVRWSNASGNPTAADMAPYCAVVIGNDWTWESAGLTKATVGNALADYLDAGGHVIEAEYIQSFDNYGFAGRYMTGGYSPFTPATLDNWFADTMNIVVPAHPVMAGVTSIGDNYGQQDPGLAPGATLLATWGATSYNAVAVKPNVVALNMLLTDASDWTGDIPLLLNNALKWLCIPTAPILKAAGATLTAENCAPANGVIDPAETVTVSLGIKNTGIPTTNLVATLQATGGVFSPPVSQTYGVIASGATATQPFTFTVDPALACGGSITLTLALMDGTLDLGTVTYTMTSGVVVVGTPATFSNTASITIPSSGAATPYPSPITVTGMTGVVNKVTATLTTMSHTYPDDIQILLVGPAGQKMILMQNAGYSYDLVNVTLTFDDAAAASLPDATQITSGTYKPSQFGPVAAYPAPAPAGPYGTRLDVFNGTDPNGAWDLFVFDDAGGDLGSISGGWSLTITPQTSVCCVGCPTITLAPLSPLPTGLEGTAYSQVITASGGALVYTFAVTAGALPAGIVLGSDGTLSGTPSVSGLFDFTVTATDLVGCTGSLAYSLLICPVITISPATLPNGLVGAAYSQAVTAAGGTAPYTYAVTAGVLPTGLSLAPDGTLSGTPTIPAVFACTIAATDANGCTGSLAYTIRICPVISITPATLPAGLVGAGYSQSFVASGGTAPYTFVLTAGALPAGLVLGTDGALSGTPSVSGLFGFTVMATDANGCTGSQACTLRICPIITISPSYLPPFLVGEAYSETLVASGGTDPYTYAVTAGALPDGITLSPGGVLSGTPTASGDFSFTITATDANGCTGSQDYSTTTDAYNLSFMDDRMRTQACVNSYTGDWQFIVFPGPQMTGIYSGAGTVYRTGKSYRYDSLPGDGPRFNLIYNEKVATAKGTLMIGLNSCLLSDLYTFDDPPCGGGGSPNFAD